MGGFDLLNTFENNAKSKVSAYEPLIPCMINNIFSHWPEPTPVDDRVNARRCELLIAVRRQLLPQDI